MFEPVVQAVAVRAPNFIREPATSNEPLKMHIRLTENQLDNLVDEFHQWRDVNGQARYATSHAMMKTFLHYVASGGYYRQVGLTMGKAKNTVCVNLRKVADYFMAIAGNHIVFPEREELDIISRNLPDVNNLKKKVVLYI